MKPFFEQGGIRVFHGDARELLPCLGDQLDDVSCVIADPSYGVTSLAWDRWPAAWPMAIAKHVPEAASLWCFGSMRMLLDRATDFSAAGWRYAQDIVWEKQNGSGFDAERFRRVHEHAVMFYRGLWADVYTKPQFTNDATARTRRSKARPPHTGRINPTPYVSEDGGPRLMRSVLQVDSVHGDADVYNETQKPIGIVEPLVRYSLRPGSVLLDPVLWQRDRAGGGEAARRASHRHRRQGGPM